MTGGGPRRWFYERFSIKNRVGQFKEKTFFWKDFKETHDNVERPEFAGATKKKHVWGATMFPWHGKTLREKLPVFKNPPKVKDWIDTPGYLTETYLPEIKSSEVIRLTGKTAARLTEVK